MLSTLFSLNKHRDFMSQRIKEYHCSLLHHQLSLLANEISVLEPFLPLNIITEERKKEKEREKKGRKAFLKER